MISRQNRYAANAMVASAGEVSVVYQDGPHVSCSENGAHHTGVSLKLGVPGTGKATGVSPAVRCLNPRLSRVVAGGKGGWCWNGGPRPGLGPGQHPGRSEVPWTQQNHHPLYLGHSALSVAPLQALKSVHETPPSLGPRGPVMSLHPSQMGPR